MNVKIFRRFADEVMRGFTPYSSAPIRQKEAHLLTLLEMEKDRPLHFYARHVGLEKGSFTYLIETMEDKGLIQRKEDYDDRRRKYLILTEKGKSIVNEIKLQEESYLNDVFKGLSFEDRNTLDEASSVIEKFLSSREPFNKREDPFE